MSEIEEAEYCFDADKLGDVDLVVNVKKLGKASLSFPQSKLDRKINLKLLKQDVQILDMIAAHYNVARSVIVNEILYRILLDDFNSIRDVDTKFLIANAADYSGNYSSSGFSWIDTILLQGARYDIVFAHDEKSYLYQGEVIPFSDSYKQLHARLEKFRDIKDQINEKYKKE